MNVYQAINAVQRDLSTSGITKDRTNTFDNYKFRGIDDVYNVLCPLLAKHGLCILPRILTREVVEHQSQKGGVLFYVTVEAEFDFVCAEDGSKHVVRTFGEAMDRGDKATNKAMSAAYKYAAFQAFAIPTEADNDADATSHQVRASAVIAPAKIAAEEAATLVSDADKEALFRDLDEVLGLAETGKTTPLIEFYYSLPSNEHKMIAWAEIPAPLRALIKRNQPQSEK